MFLEVCFGNANLIIKVIVIFAIFQVFENFVGFSIFLSLSAHQFFFGLKLGHLIVFSGNIFVLNGLM